MERMMQRNEQAEERREIIAEAARDLPNALDYYRHFSALPDNGQSFVFGFIYGFQMANTQAAPQPRA